MTEPERCAWALSDPLYVAYHDEEWGVPIHDPHHLFELLCLEGAQAGLAWITILRKRDGYRAAFDGFDARRMAADADADRERLMADAGIVRNRAKIDAFIGNARAFGEVADFSGLVWSFVGGRTLQNRWRERRHSAGDRRVCGDVPRASKAAGFSFVGPTICYAFMQSAGLVNDHVVACFRHAELDAAAYGARAGTRRAAGRPTAPRDPMSALELISLINQVLFVGLFVAVCGMPSALLACGVGHRPPLRLDRRWPSSSSRTFAWRGLSQEPWLSASCCSG